MIDCAELSMSGKGTAYSHEYERAMGFFKSLAYATSAAMCENVPPEWVPFVLYLGHVAVSTGEALSECGSLAWGAAYAAASDKRRVVEVASACRPELVHALYCADTEWPCPLVQHDPKRAFVVTCNGSFFRQEVREYRARLTGYEPPTPRRAVLVPCAASKPYPAPLHEAVMQRVPEEWGHLIIATGVLGLLPQGLWPAAPLYDSGLPNMDRVTRTVAWYFTAHRYERLVVFSDFYANAVAAGLALVPSGLRPSAEFVLGTHYRDTYENLMLTEHLDALEVAVRS